MTREERIEFLKGLQNGSRSINELIPENYLGVDEIDVSMCTVQQLDTSLEIGMRIGKDYFFSTDPDLTDDDRKHLDSLPRKKREPDQDERPNLSHLTPEELEYLLQKHDTIYKQ